MSFLNKSLEDQQAVFALFDSGNGSITADGLANAVRTLGYTPTKEELAELGKGPFNFESFKAATEKFVCLACRFKTFSEFVQKDTTSSEDAMEAFSTFDIHSNGFISVKDVTTVLQNLGEPLNADELQAALKAMEPDAEQQINLAFIVQKFLSN